MANLKELKKILRLPSKKRGDKYIPCRLILVIIEFHLISKPKYE
jgi:hypothetical protein